MGQLAFLFTNRLAIVAILSLMSADIVESLLSNVLLSGRLVNPQDSIILLLYGKSIARKSRNARLESNLNHILTTKHLSITVGG